MAKKRNRSNRPRPTGAAATRAPAATVRDPDDDSLGDTDAARPSDVATPSADDLARPGSRAAPKAAAARASDKRRPDKRATPIVEPDRSGVRADLEPPREPVFWFGFEVAWAKLATARVVVFALLALDAFLQLRHAPRYGAGDFNVGQLPLLDALGPGRVGYTVGQLIESYLFVLAALGVATRWVVPAAALLYGWLYFGSQLDSYQHHYLVALVLGIACFVPWQRPAGATPSTPVRTWAIRLVLVQLAIMYLWAAISKLDPQWLSGRTLASQLTGPLRAMIDRTVGMAVASVSVVAVELALACTVWMRRTRLFAAALGVVFHLGIVASGLEIGLFAYLMLALYLLVIPDEVFVWLAQQGPLLGLRRRARAAAEATSWIALAVAIALGAAAAWTVRVELAFAVGLALAVVPLAVALVGKRATVALALAHVAAFGLWGVVDRLSSVAVDYDNFWGGSQRRLGNTGEAERAYRALIEIAPERSTGHYQLGRILVRSERADEGIAHLREAQRLEPSRARAWIEEARWLATEKRIDDAIAKAKRATFAEPSNSEARTLLQSLLATRSAPAATDRDDEPDAP